MALHGLNSLRPMLKPWWPPVQRSTGILEQKASGGGLVLYGPQHTSGNPENIVASGSNALRGFWSKRPLEVRYGTAWTELTTSNLENMVVSGSTLYGDFGALGLWKWDGTAWTQLPKMMVSN